MNKNRNKKVSTNILSENGKETDEPVKNGKEETDEPVENGKETVEAVEMVKKKVAKWLLVQERII